MAAQHSVLFPGRDVDSIRRKYHTLHRRGIPTGDPLCPADVKLAKKVKYDIGVKADLGVMKMSKTSKQVGLATKVKQREDLLMFQQELCVRVIPPAPSPQRIA